MNRSKRLSLLLLACALFAGCKPTYRHESMKESIRDLAKKEYKLDVDVSEIGGTVGVKYRVTNLLGEMAAEDQLIWKQLDDLMMVLSRVMLSVDKPPTFFVLELVDADRPSVRLVFTRYIDDIRKAMAEALSRSQYLDRLLIEFQVGDKKMTFDLNDMDLVRLMMMSLEAEADSAKPVISVPLENVDFKKFIARIVENSTKRLIREHRRLKEEFQIRDVKASYAPSGPTAGTLNVLLDIVTQPSAVIAPQTIERRVLPLVGAEVAQLFKSYRFKDFAGITVVEKNTGKTFNVPR